MPQPRAWTFSSFGLATEVLRLTPQVVPEPQERECLVRVQALALNFPDLLVLSGKYQVKPELPAVLGMEAMGVVEAIGAHSRYRVGDRVCINVVHGAFAERAVFPEAFLLPLPAAMSDAQGAAFHVTYQTSFFALGHRAQLRAGETLLVHGAAGGVGTSAVQLGKALGARVIATASGSRKCEVARSCGADWVVNTQTEDFVERVKSLTEGRGADVIYDPVGGETFDKSTKVLAFEGRLLVIGFASGVIPTISVNRLLLKTASVVGIQWGMYKFVSPDKVVAAHDRLCALFSQGKITPVVDPQRFSFEQLPQALRHLESRQAVGKVIVECGPAA